MTSQKANKTKPADEFRIKSVVVSRKGAALRVVRLELSEEMKRQLTVSDSAARGFLRETSKIGRRR